MFGFSVSNTSGEVVLDDKFFTIKGVDIVVGPGKSTFPFTSEFVGIGVKGKHLNKLVKVHEANSVTITCSAQTTITVFYEENLPPQGENSYGLEILGKSGEVTFSTNSKHFEIKSKVDLTAPHTRVPPYTLYRESLEPETIYMLISGGREITSKIVGGNPTTRLFFEIYIAALRSSGGYVEVFTELMGGTSTPGPAPWEFGTLKSSLLKLK